MNKLIFFVLFSFREFCTGLELPVISVRGKLSQSNYVLPGEPGYFDVTTGWVNISDSMPMYELALFGRSLFKKDVLTIDCTASYPIEWKISGHTTHHSIITMLPVERNLRKRTYKVSMKTNVFDFYTEYLVRSSLQIACEGLSNPKDVSHIYLFAGYTLYRTHSEQLVDTNLLPCGTYNPQTKVQLYQLEDKAEILVANASYVYKPTEGFYSSSGFWNGLFKCRQGKYTLNVTAVDSHLKSTAQKSYFFPEQDQIYSFADKPISLKCMNANASSSSFKVVVDDQAFTGIEDPPATKRVQDAVKNLIVTRIVNGSTLFLNVSLKSLPETSTTWSQGVSCANNNDDKQRSKNWNLNFLAPPKLDLDNFKRKISCLTPRLSGGEITTIQCSNAMDCSYRKGCISDRSTCVAGEVSNTPLKSQCLNRLSINPEQKLVRCATLPYSHLSGIVECKAHGASKQWQFFHSLNLIKYTSWMNIPENELVRFDEVPSVLYTNGTTNFTCQSVAFLFANSLTFELEFSNKSKVILDEATGIDFKLSDEINPRRIDNLNFLETIQVILPLEATGIYCVAPWGNSTDVIRIKREFETRHLRHPYFNDGQGESMQATFTAGQTNYRLACPVKGEPKPEYEWFHNNLRIFNTFPELQTSIDSQGQGYLGFPSIADVASGSKYVGTFTCEAKNSVGRVRRKIHLQIAEKSSLATFYGTAIGIPLFIFLAVLIALLIITARRYRQSQELLRALTDGELKEFFNGRPDLLENISGATFEVVDFLPYRSDYEISPDDLVIGDLLGKGHFSFVFKGKITSKGMHVAVKTVKADAGVNLFKTFLSEVKILMFIGEHENVVKLVGVCTGDIRNRSIVIATEICELGSLDNCLIEWRPRFIDLINENQHIERSLCQQTQGQYINELFTTLDLLHFCMQIASGMTYLSNKSVIHADLACRNVLIKADKTVKISDFGLSKKLYQCENYVKKSKTPLPWRWMAIESLTTMTFSTKSDVWSYGATLYEIFSLGGIPFPNEKWDEDFVSRLSGGMRMGRPEFSTPEIYTKIVACWEKRPEQRPDFPSLHEYFLRVFNKYSSNEVNSVTTASTHGKETPSAAQRKERPIQKNLYENNC